MKRHTVLLAFAAALAGSLLHAASAAPRGELAEGDVYRMIVRSTTAGNVDEWSEWIDPVSGRWRQEQGGKTYIYNGTSYAILDRRQGAHVRTGSPAFLGTAPERITSRDVLRRYLSGSPTGIEIKEVDGKVDIGFKRGGVSFVSTIVEKLAAADVQQRKLFVVSPDEITSAVTERRVGVRPAVAVKAYWFGMRFSGRFATTAVEHFAGPAGTRGGARGSTARDSFAYHVTFYEMPAAGGKTSAYPGTRPPAGEVQVLSQPVSSWVAQRTIKVYDGINGALREKPWPRSTVKLRGGETATVVPDRSGGTGKVRKGFAVITRTTLVNVSGTFQLRLIPGLAAQLQPIA